MPCKKGRRVQAATSCGAAFVVLFDVVADSLHKGHLAVNKVSQHARLCCEHAGDVCLLWQPVALPLAL
jgi:hypothetical protein